MFKTILFFLFTCIGGIQQSAFAEQVQTQEQTLAIIKPDAVAEGHIGDIISRLEKSHLKIVSMKMVTLSKEQAARFYDSLNDKPFFPHLTVYMSSGPIVVMTLEGQDAVKKYRTLMGPTDPKKAPPGSLRSDFGENIGKNAVHGSDSPESAKKEIEFFFKSTKIN